jgi:hypothetical protein
MSDSNGQQKKTYSVLAHFTLMGIVQKPNLRLYFSQNQPVAIPIFVSVISLETF